VYSPSQLGLNKYNQEAYDLTMEMFDQIPLSCLINKKFLCVHGGISYELKTVPLSPRSSRTSRRSTGSGRSPSRDCSAT
jgi:diadenosine tetraphosphatase ApaH/serine/threonine PP2A family protein phosphatase